MDRYIDGSLACVADGTGEFDGWAENVGGGAVNWIDFFNNGLVADLREGSGGPASLFWVKTKKSHSDPSRSGVVTVVME